METLIKQLKEYQQFHTDKVNKLTHYISIPAIVFSLIIALSWISITIAAQWHISFAWIAIIVLLVYYYFLDIKLAVLMTVILVLLTLLGTWIAFPAPTTASLILFLVLFIGGVALAFIGHAFEKAQRSFSTYLKYLAIAPLYVVTELLLALGWGKYFDLLEEPQPPKAPPSSKPPSSKTPPYKK